MKYMFSLYLAFSVFFSSLVMLFYQNTNQILFSVNEDRKISFTFHENTTSEQAESKAIEIKNKFNLSSAAVITPADQYTDFIKSFAMYNQGAFEAEEILKLIPYALDVTLSDSQDRDEIRKKITAENTFQETETSSIWIRKLKSLSALLEKLGRFLFLFLFTSTALMTAATIRILVFENEHRIQIQSYLGESFISVLRSYLLKTGALCALAIGFGFLLSYVGYQFLVLKITSFAEFSFIANRIQFLDLKSILVLCLGFLVAFVAGSFFSYQKMYDRIYNED